MEPLVSIHIITYNQRAFIDETLTSALGQEYENLEVIVADDGSTDGTAERIQEYARANPGRLVPITGGPNLGITGNSNRALKACRGKYIAFQGGDDILLPGKIKSQVAWLEADESRVLCTHDVDVFDSTSGRTLHYWSDLFELRHGNGLGDILTFGHPCIGPGTAIMIRASCMPIAGFDDRLRAASDIKFFYDCLAAGGSFGFIPGVFARYRQHTQNIQRTGRQMLIADSWKILELLEAEYPRYSDYFPRVRKLLYHSLAVWSIRDGEYAAGRKYLLSEMRLNPLGMWKYIILYLYTLLPKPIPAVIMDFSSRLYKSIKRNTSRAKKWISNRFVPQK
jgi:glycosyltransferase involved in cell wall biosynthesis